MKVLFKLLFKVLLSVFVMGCSAILVIILYINAKLPSVENLEDVKLQVPLRIYSQDGKLMGEYGEKRRTPVKIEDVPEKLKLAVLATEDRRFYEHSGVDLRGLMRASLHLMTRGTKEQGASTITMQVARNFYLSRKKTYTRKLNEILLAIKIEKELSKDKILELYLNKIYFGKRAYGVEAAAYVYYGKSISELSLDQMAMLAGLPQAPSAINPLNNPQGALKRRSHVLNRMKYYGFITEEEYEKANLQPLSASYHGPKIEAYAPYAAEAARQWLIDQYGPTAYTDGYEVYTTINSALQKKAELSLQSGLLAYDKRHGYRGPAGHLTLDNTASPDWEEIMAPYQRYGNLLPALVTHIEDNKITARLSQGQVIEVPFETMGWAKRRQQGGYLGPKPASAKNVVAMGDVIYVEPSKNQWQFSQVPEASAALVALDPHNGAILSLTGGFDFKLSSFNRAVQAYRQPGSNFKPIIYSAALENGFTAASIINDAPVVFHDATLEGVWRPQNDSQRFYGPTRLRVGLTKSRNLVSIRLLQELGLKKAKIVMERFGFLQDRLPNGLSLALGTMTTTPLEIARAYAVFANGGYKVEPFIVEKIVNSDGSLVYKANPPDICESCDDFMSSNDPFFEESPHTERTQAPRVLSAQTAFIMDSILKDAIQTGTGRKAKDMNRRDIAGKTGTTNQQMDAWYSGYNPNIVTSVWVGFDEPKSLKEYGAQAALPIWIDFMSYALQGTEETLIPEPAGIVTVRIDPDTGLLASPDSTKAIFELFKEENVPQQVAPSKIYSNEVTLTPSSGDDQSLF